MAHGMSKEEQRQRIIEVVRKKEGVDCPELVVDWAGPLVGGGQVNYKCTKHAPLQYLDLDPEQARYVGIDMSVRESPEAGGY
jgi:hypothetical protein